MKRKYRRIKARGKNATAYQVIEDGELKGVVFSRFEGDPKSRGGYAQLWGYDPEGRKQSGPAELHSRTFAAERLAA